VPVPLFSFFLPVPLFSSPLLSSFLLPVPLFSLPLSSYLVAIVLLFHSLQQLLILFYDGISEPVVHPNSSVT
jgi:hypothetical protein